MRKRWCGRVCSGGPKDGVRLLGGGKLTAKIAVTVVGASKSAIAAVEEAGGSVTVVASPAASLHPRSAEATEDVQPS